MAMDLSWNMKRIFCCLTNSNLPEMMATRRLSMTMVVTIQQVVKNTHPNAASLLSLAYTVLITSPVSGSFTYNFPEKYPQYVKSPNAVRKL